MHELSLVKSIFSTLEETLEENEMEHVSLVELNIGLLANVEPILLQNAFTAFQESNPQYDHISLQSNMIEIKIMCSSCQQESIVENYIFRCKACDTPSNQIVSGEELLIHRIHYDS